MVYRFHITFPYIPSKLARLTKNIAYKNIGTRINAAYNNRVLH